MPVIFHKHINSSLSVEVWHFAESEEFFLSNLVLSSADLAQLQAIALPKRRLERLACRMALQDLLRKAESPINLTDLEYTSAGKPVLSPIHISFSHSGQYAAVALSSTGPVGIDIEQVGSRLQRGYRHFLNEEEISTCNVSSDEELHYYWGAKEALYKLENTSRYQQQITIKPIRERTGLIMNNDNTKQYRIWHNTIDNLCLVVAYSE